LLHRLDRPTFFTRDLGFYDRRRCHNGYSIVCLAVGQNEVARFISRFLRHANFNTKAKRMGTVVPAGGAVLRLWRMHGNEEERFRGENRRGSSVGCVKRTRADAPLPR
jgi:hypothetical protein